MIEIKDLLSRFGNILASEEFKGESVRRAITEVIGLPLEPKDVKVKNGTIFLDAKPIYKNEILIKKEKILSKIQEYLGERSPHDIR